MLGAHSRYHVILQPLLCEVAADVEECIVVQSYVVNFENRPSNPKDESSLSHPNYHRNCVQEWIL